MTVWKYPLAIQHLQEIRMPAGAHPVHVGRQGNNLCLWAIVDPDRPPVLRRIGLRGTGAAFGPEEDIGSYLGTVQMEPFVWHLFDLGEK